MNEINFLASDLIHYDIIDITSMRGGPDQPHTPETEIPNMALEWFRPMQFYSLI